MRKYLNIIFFVAILISSNVIVGQNLISPDHTPPTAQFSIVNVCYGDSAHFINQSHGGATNFWIIKYIDPILLDTLVLDTIPTFDLTYYFSPQGTYLITLQENNGHITEITKTVIINNVLKADFEFENCSNNLINMSTCATSYYWDFGDGTTSTSIINNHQYADTGYYQVKCIVSNGVTYDTLVKQIYVSDIGYPKLTFTYTLSNDTLYGYITCPLGPHGNVTWYYGDSYSDNQANVIHVYKDSTASYNIGIRVFNSCGMIFRDTVIDITMLATDIESYNFKKVVFNIYPNPSSDIVTINEKNVESIVIYNIQGQTEFEIETINSELTQQIDIRTLTNGIHFVKIKVKGKLLYSKFIKIF